MEKAPRFAIGTIYQSAGKAPRLCTVVDIHRTYDNAGDLVRLEYVTIHTFAGQFVREYGVSETTIARGLCALHGVHSVDEALHLAAGTVSA